MNDQERVIVAAQIRNLFVPIVFAACASFLFGGFGRSMLLFVVVLACSMLNLARRWLDRGAVLLLILTFLVVFEIIPSPAAWSDNVKNIAIAVCHKPEAPQ
jgi:hypothetical protein